MSYGKKISSKLSVRTNVDNFKLGSCISFVLVSYTNLYCKIYININVNSGFFSKKPNFTDSF